MTVGSFVPKLVKAVPFGAVPVVESSVSCVATSKPFLKLPRAVAVLTILPASILACVIVKLRVNVPSAPGAKLAGVVATFTAPITGSLMTTPVMATFPVFLTLKSYLTAVPTAPFPTNDQLLVSVSSGFCAMPVRLAIAAGDTPPCEVMSDVLLMCSPPSDTATFKVISQDPFAGIAPPLTRNPVSPFTKAAVPAKF